MTIQLGTKLHVPDGGVKHLIEQAYNAGGKYQWVREATVNSLQAEATIVEFGLVRPLMENNGVIKRYVADNGLGMDVENLPLFMTSFGEGGRPIGLNENFGQGLKSSCFSWNPYGLLVLSWTEGDPDGVGIWIQQDEKGDWGLRQFFDVDGYIETFVPGWDDDLGFDLSELKFDFIKEAGHGTVFVFLGDSFERSTEDGDYTRGEDSIRGIALYLNRRFLELPEGVSVRAVGLEAKADPEDTERRDNKDRVVEFPNKTRKSWHARNVHGVKATIPELEASGSVEVDAHGTIVDWYLAKKAPSGDQSYSPRYSQILIDYASNAAGVKLHEAYDIRTSIRDYRSFGITDEGVAARTWLIIRPPILDVGSPTRWGVMTQASRSILVAKGGEPLPWEMWGDEFYKKLPKPIMDALAAARATNTQAPDIADRVKNIITRLAARMRPLRLVSKTGGTQSGNPIGETGTTVKRGRKVKPTPKTDTNTPTTNPVGAAGTVSVLRPHDKGVEVGEPLRRGDGIPNARWEAFGEQDGGPTFAARYDAKAGTSGAGEVVLNTTFTMFVTEFDYWSTEYPKAPAAKVEQIVKDAYAEYLVAKVIHINGLKGKIEGLSAGDIAQMQGPLALTVGLLGLVNVESRIRTVAGATFGKSTSAKIA